MGTALRDDQRLDSLGGIRESYARAFSESFEAIQAAIMDKALDRLSVIRNLIVHRDGVADKTYVEALAFLDGLPKADEGHPIKLDGEVVTKILAAAFDATANLVHAVEDWALAN